LREQKQLTTTYAKILEINPEHAVIRSLAQRIGGGAAEEDAKVRDIALLLLDQAKILEGEEVSDPSAFSERINNLLKMGLAA
jgi:molecular chaperone HtpG